MTGAQLQFVHAKGIFIASLASICLSLSGAGSAHAAILWQFNQTNSGVIGTFSGSLNVLGVPQPDTDLAFLFSSGSIDPTNGYVLNVNVAEPTDYYELGFFEPSPPSFGPGGFTYADSRTGPSLGILVADSASRWLVVPLGYTSGTPLSGSIAFLGETFASLGIVPGDYAFGLFNQTGGLIDTIDVNFVPPSEVPLPATLPLFATGLGALGLLGWRRKRKQKAA